MKNIPATIAIAVVLFLAAPASAADFGRYWSGFTNFWGRIFGSVGGIAGVVLLTGIIGIFIITRGKWLK